MIVAITSKNRGFHFLFVEFVMLKIYFFSISGVFNSSADCSRRGLNTSVLVLIPRSSFSSEMRSRTHLHDYRKSDLSVVSLGN